VRLRWWKATLSRLPADLIAFLELAECRKAQRQRKQHEGH
jgi:hypothetical protein